MRKLTRFREDEDYLRGYCELSGGMRTFRKDRIVTVIDDADLAAFSGVRMPGNGGKRETVDDDYRWEICFTGFGQAERQDLEGIARANGMQVRSAVTRNLDFLCIGDNAGPKKMQEAEAKGCLIITADQFHDFIQDGVLPESFSEKKKSVKWREISVEQARQYFAGWVFRVEKAHWAALGIQWREFIDKERTADLRAWWDTQNPRYVTLTERRKVAAKGEYKGRITQHPEHAEWVRLNSQRLAKVYTYWAYGLSDPLALEFHEGDVFWNSFRCVQVVSGYAPLEVKYHDRPVAVTGYNLTEKAFAKWLEKGKPPDDERRIERNQSQSAIAQYHEYTR